MPTGGTWRLQKQTYLCRTHRSIRQLETDRLRPWRTPVHHIRASRSLPWRHDADDSSVAVFGRVVEFPVGACVGVGGRVEHPRLDAGVLDEHRVAVFGARTIGHVARQTKTHRATFYDVGRATRPASPKHDDVVRRRLWIGADSDIEADNHRRWTAELDVYGSVVLEVNERLRQVYHASVFLLNTSNSGNSDDLKWPSKVVHLLQAFAQLCSSWQDFY